MEVIGIVQTNINEFDILFNPLQKQDEDTQTEKKQASDENNSNDFFSFLLGGNSDEEQGDDKGKDSLQEMTVRIKGVPEGQKATFLQMYQIMQDAKEVKDLEDNLTIVSRGQDRQQDHDRTNSLQSGGGNGNRTGFPHIKNSGQSH